MITTGPHIRFFERHLRKLLRPTLVKALKTYRWTTRHFRTLPDFVIIGARKCGTTSLYEYLVQHPNVLPAFTKELYYFDYHHEKGSSWYASHFPTLAEKKFYEKNLGIPAQTGEATPSYFYHPLVAARLAELLPQAKLLLLLREPIAAAYSAYQFGLKRGIYTTQEYDFELAIQKELSYLKQGGSLFEQKDGANFLNHRCSLLARHAYIELLEPWLAAFDPGQIKVIVSEDMFANPAATYAEVLEFLGLPPHKLATYQAFNENYYPPLAQESQLELARFFTPYNQRLRCFLGRDVLWNYEDKIHLSRPLNRAAHEVTYGEPAVRAVGMSK